MALSTLMSPAPPLWWNTRSALNSNPAQDNAVVNQGQLKHFTQKSVEELNARIPGGAGPDLNNLVQSWKDAYISQNHSPENPDPADFQAIATGQLKWIAQKIHDRLVYARYEDQAPAWLNPNPTTDNQLANLGQLKTLFAFDLTAPDGQIPQWWQKFYAGTTNPPTYPTSPGNGNNPGGGNQNPAAADSDHDGLSNEEDAMPNEPLVDWKKTPEFSYLWIPVEGTPGGYHPVEVNNRGQILFANTTFNESCWWFPGWVNQLPTVPVAKLWDPSKPANQRWRDIFFSPSIFKLRVSRSNEDNTSSVVPIEIGGLYNPPTNGNHFMESFSVGGLSDDGSVMANAGYWYTGNLGPYGNRDYTNATGTYVFLWKSGSYESCQLLGGEDRGCVADLENFTFNVGAGFFTDPASSELRAVIYDQVCSGGGYQGGSEIGRGRSDTNLKSYSLKNGVIGAGQTIPGIPDRLMRRVFSFTALTRSGRATLSSGHGPEDSHMVIDGGRQIPIGGLKESFTLTDLPTGGWALGGPDAPLQIYKSGGLQTTALSGITDFDELGTGIGGGAWPGTSTSGHDLWRNGDWFSFADLTGDDKPPAGTAPQRITSKGIIWAANWERTSNGILVPVAMDLFERGTINAPGPMVPHPSDPRTIYEVVNLENADWDEFEAWEPNSMGSASQPERQDGATGTVHVARDDDFVKIHLQCPPLNLPGYIDLIMDQPGDGRGIRMRTEDLRFHIKAQGQEISLADLRIPDLINPSGILARMMEPKGLDLFIEIADLGQLTLNDSQANQDSRRFADLILRINIAGTSMQQKVRIYRGGYWNNQRHGNNGTISFNDGKGRYLDEDGVWKLDVGKMAHGPFAIQSGKPGITDSTVRNVGPTPPGWYGLYERLDFTTQWSPGGRPQLDHSLGRSGPLGYLQQGSYCQWSVPGNRAGQEAHGNYQHMGANPPASIHFKFQLVEAYEITNRDLLQIHPDGFNDGTAGCVGIQNYEDCCKVFFLLRHYFGTNLQVTEN